MSKHLTPTDIEKTIEDFVVHFYNGDYEISKDAFKINISIGEIKGSIGHVLVESLTAFVIARAQRDEYDESEAAKVLIKIITRLHSEGLITESKSFLSKFEEVEKQNKQLKEIEQQLKAEILKLKR